MKQRLLYLMHLPWGWIKQRPHFLAEHLTEHFDIDLYHRFYHVPFEGKLVKNPVANGLSVRSLPVLPLNRFGPVARINAGFCRFRLRRTITDYPYVWVTHPEMFEIIAPILPKKAHLVYDCMDNHCEFNVVKRNAQFHTRVQDSERVLIRRSDTVFASSDHLRDILERRYGREDIQVARNAIFIDDHPDYAAPFMPADPSFFKLVYIGTIASWMDMDLLEKAVENFQNLSILLYGPAETPMPAHPRITHCGPVPHAAIYDIMRRADALFMPFVVNDLILGVDPVKLYEYAYSGKPALAIRYPETEKFSRFVHLYGSHDEFFGILRKMMDGEVGAKCPPEECRQFACDNTWSRRAAAIREILRRGQGSSCLKQ